MVIYSSFCTCCSNGLLCSSGLFFGCCGSATILGFECYRILVDEGKMTIAVDNDQRLLAVPGGKDIILSPDDFSTHRSWERLCLGMPLRDYDFLDINMWKRYWILTHGLTEGVVVNSGAEGSGKSLWMYYMGYTLQQLFGKGCTFDIPPKEGFGHYRSIDDDTFCEELEKFKEIAKMEKAKEMGEVSEQEFQNALNQIKLYNTVIGIDEAYDKLERARRGNFAVNVGRLIRKYRHFHILFILVSPDKDDIDKRMAFKRRTHEVSCFFNGHICRYNIWQRRANRWTGHELTPSNWAFLWGTTNIIGSTVLPIKRG